MKKKIMIASLINLIPNIYIMCYMFNDNHPETWWQYGNTILVWIWIVATSILAWASVIVYTDN